MQTAVEPSGKGHRNWGGRVQHMILLDHCFAEIDCIIHAFIHGTDGKGARYCDYSLRGALTRTSFNGLGTELLHPVKHGKDSKTLPEGTTKYLTCKPL
jgi:hypothetical protein